MYFSTRYKNILINLLQTCCCTSKHTHTHNTHTHTHTHTSHTKLSPYSYTMLFSFFYTAIRSQLTHTRADAQTLSHTHSYKLKYIRGGPAFEWETYAPADLFLFI